MLDQLRRRKWNWLGYTLRWEEVMTALPDNAYSGNCKTGKKRATKENLEKRSGERIVDRRFQVQLEEDGAQDRAGWRQVRVVCGLCSAGHVSKYSVSVVICRLIINMCCLLCSWMSTLWLPEAVHGCFSEAECLWLVRSRRELILVQRAI